MNDPSPDAGRFASLRFKSPFRWLRAEIDRLFDDFSRPSRPVFRFGDEVVPAFDLEEGEDGYRLSAELPGMKHEDVEISVADRDLCRSSARQGTDLGGSAYRHDLEPLTVPTRASRPASP